MPWVTEEEIQAAKNMTAYANASGTAAAKDKDQK